MIDEEKNRMMKAEEEGWRKWGPYLSERQWGTVREDYSPDGKAWNYFPHDHARSRAYRWGEDGIAGISDDQQKLCFSIALWNGCDPILKERLFGLTGNEGNHGEDVKEYYFYLDNVPSHSYMKYLYKYPQLEFPYKNLLEENQRRTRNDPEYELLDTGIFNEDKYFDVFVEYAKESIDDILVRITIANRGPDTATVHLLPTLWFRNEWSWFSKEKKPELALIKKGQIEASHAEIGDYYLYFDPAQKALFTENETNTKRIFDVDNESPYVKDAFHSYLIQNDTKAINPDQTGTKAAVHYPLQIVSGKEEVIKLRLSRKKNISDPLGRAFDVAFESRIAEADTFYEGITPYVMPDDMRNVQRQAYAGLLWNKQFYCYDVEAWLNGDAGMPKPAEIRKDGRNKCWKTFGACDIFSMPDKWEYPWFAAWDLAFHTVAFASIDPNFAKKQLLLLTDERYMHPNGQVPAYEWSFSDVNPPVQAWAAMRVYQIERSRYGIEDRLFLEKMFQKLSLNFTWWVNRKDSDNRNIFEGGFLGLDNIGPFDRDKGIPCGGKLQQVDGTGWMGMYALNLLEIALELAKKDEAYEDMATKFFEHFIYIADAMNSIGDQKGGLWNSDAEFYHGLLTLPDGREIKISADTLIGIVPLFAVAPNNPKMTELFPSYRKRFEWFVENRSDLLKGVMELSTFKEDKRFLLALASPKKLKGILRKILNEKEFLSPFGLRSVSKALGENPYVLHLDGKEFCLNYEPAESTSGLFGGNSNWRGPIWFPLNFLLIEALQKYHYYLGDEFLIEYPSNSGKQVTLWDISMDLTRRLIQIFLKDEKGWRPLYGGMEKFQTDPHWKDYILFHEYFHGDNGAGLGASNQTGWTGVVAKLIQQYGEYALQKRPAISIEEYKIGPL